MKYSLPGESIPTNSNKWRPNEPNNLDNNQHCLAIENVSGKYLYDDDTCSAVYPIVCQFTIN